jgi:hypothetical protein
MNALAIIRLAGKEFADMEDTEIEKWLDLALPRVSRKTFGKLYEQALAFLTMHIMKLAGAGEVAAGGGSASGSSFGESLRLGSYSEGSVSESYAVNISTALQKDGDLALTEYGIQFLALRRMAIIPIRSAGEAR